MSDSFHNITEYSKLNLKNMVPKIYSFAHVGQPCFRIFVKENVYMYSALTDDFMKSYLTRARQENFVTAILHWKQGLLCD